MKTDRESKALQELEVSERELKQVLLTRLPAVVEGGFPLFEIDALAPAVRSGRVHEESERLYRTAESCLRSRDRLQLPVAGSVGSLFIAACAEFCSSGEHRRGPRKLAAALLEELRRAA